MNKLTKPACSSSGQLLAILAGLFSLFFLFSQNLYAAENAVDNENVSWEWDDANADEEELTQADKAYLKNQNQNQIAVESWELMKDQYGVQLYLGTVKGTNVKAFKGVVQINSSINSLLAVMIDAKACPDWVHDCETSYLVHDKGVRDRYVYQSYDLMFPAGKRDYLFYASVNQNPITHSVSINMEAAPDFCNNNPDPKCTAINQSNNIMIQKSTGSYVLQPMADGSTLVTWEQFTDPAGNLPVFIVNQLVLNVPFMTLKGLQDIVKDQKYQFADNVLEQDIMLTGNIGE